MQRRGAPVGRSPVWPLVRKSSTTSALNSLLIAEGDKVGLVDSDHDPRGRVHGEAPTGKRVTMTGIDISRVADGKIVETWHVEDSASLMQQLTSGEVT